MQMDLRLNWLIAIALTGWLFYLLAPVLTPFVAAALLAYMGDPLADRMQKLKLPRALAVVELAHQGLEGVKRRPATELAGDSKAPVHDMSPTVRNRTVASKTSS